MNTYLLLLFLVMSSKLRYHSQLGDLALRGHHCDLTNPDSFDSLFGFEWIGV